MVYDLEFMKTVITNADICYEVLEEVKLIALDSQFAKWEHLINSQESVVGVALHTLPEIKWEVEQAIKEVLNKKLELREQQQQQQQQNTKNVENSVKKIAETLITVDMIEFISVCEFYSNSSLQVQELLFQFQKSLLPFNTNLAEKMFKMASISRSNIVINDNNVATSKGKKRRA